MDVEDVFNEIAALTSGEVNVMATPVEEKVTPPSEKNVDEVSPMVDNEVEDIEQEYERQVDSFAEQVRQEIVADFPEESEEISEEVNYTIENSSGQRTGRRI